CIIQGDAMKDVAALPPVKKVFSPSRVVFVLMLIVLAGLFWFRHETRKFQLRSIQVEATATLRGAMTDEHVYFARYQAYTPSVAALGHYNAAGNRYIYLFDDRGTLLAEAGVTTDPSVTGTDADRDRNPEAVRFNPVFRARTYAGNARLG